MTVLLLNTGERIRVPESPRTVESLLIQAKDVLHLGRCGVDKKGNRYVKEVWDVPVDDIERIIA